MTERWWTDAEQDPTHEAAAEWFARLQGADISAAELQAWQRWLAADRRNAEAFARLEDVCAMLSELPRPTDAETNAVQPDYDGSESITDWRARTLSSAWISRRWFALAASVAAIAVLVAGGWQLWTPQAEIIQTAIGENRTLRLSDGSSVTLGGNTLLRASFRDDERRIDLTRGEALFSVAKDATRPFRVRAGKATVTAVGTQFNVRRREDRDDVTVVEGAVVVEPLTTFSLRSLERAAHELRPETGRSKASPRAPVRIAAGEKTAVSAAGVHPVSHLADTRSPIAWRSGRLVFDSEPLRGVVEDVNRYSPKPLVIEDDTIGELLFTGTVLNGNVERWVASIQDVFSLEAIEEDDRIVLRLRH